MKVNFILDNPSKEAEYLCFLAKNIARGLYQKGGFYVLPRPETGNAHAVYFPNLNYSRNFWRKIKNCKSKNFGENFPKECIAEIISKLPKNRSAQTQKIIKIWKRKERKFFKIVQALFTKSFKNIKSIEILPTAYGTAGSYHPQGDKLTATHRIDITPDDIGQKILYLLTARSNPKIAEIGETEWIKRKAIVEHLLKNTALNNLLNELKETSPQKKEIELKRESNEYLKSLGFGDNNNLIKISQWGKTTIAGHNIHKLFTRKEEYVFKTLLANKGEIVEFSEFLKIPSLYALSKIIENIRKKISSLGINCEVITTVRGKGYCLV